MKGTILQTLRNMTYIAFENIPTLKFLSWTVERHSPFTLICTFFFNAESNNNPIVFGMIVAPPLPPVKLTLSIFTRCCFFLTGHTTRKKYTGWKMQASISRCCGSAPKLDVEVPALFCMQEISDPVPIYCFPLARSLICVKKLQNLSQNMEIHDHTKQKADLTIIPG